MVPVEHQMVAMYAIAKQNRLSASNSSFYYLPSSV